jgi:hypothetical protein
MRSDAFAHDQITRRRVYDLDLYWLLRSAERAAEAEMRRLACERSGRAPEGRSEEVPDGE